MKKAILLACSLLSVIIVMAQNVVTVSGDITSNTNWTNDNIYLLSGFVYITQNAELTIQPGTVIKGDKASKGSLIVTRGSKLIADGTLSQPIVFTSNEPVGSRTYGDWGGIIICGKAPINDPAGESTIEGGVDPVKGLYGGSDPSDNSGILRYVRIEFPGIAFMPNNEINGLTLGGVGNQTIIDYVQVSYSGDDSYECFGGTVNLKHLIAFRGLDDEFDTDFGFSGKCQFLVGVRDSNVADISGSNGFESDNDATGSTNTPTTYPIYSNVSLIGPMINAGTMINSNFKRAAHIRRSAKTSVFNSALVGYPTGLLLDGANCETNATNNELNFRYNFIAGCTTPLSVASGSMWDINAWFNTAGFNNTILPNSTDIMLTDPYNYNNPNLVPMAGSPLLSGADFTNMLLNDPFFDVVNFRGAFGANDWTAGWANWDAQNTLYTGIQENTVVSDVNLYPNPVNEQAIIRFNVKSATKLSLNVYSVDGRMVISKDLGHVSGEINESIDFSGLSMGLYTLQIQTETGMSTYKITKN